MKLTSRQKSLLHRIATATRVNYGDSPRTAGSLIRLGLVAKASGEALRLTPQGKAEFYAPTMPKPSATMDLADLSYVRSVLAWRVAASVADGDLEAPAGAKCRTRSGFRAWLRRAEKQLKAEVENSGGDLETKASSTITKLHAAKLNREASSLGRIVGAWRKGHVGDCALRNAITGSERRLAETGTPAVERAQLAEIQ